MSWQVEFHSWNISCSIYILYNVKQTHKPINLFFYTSSTDRKSVSTGGNPNPGPCSPQPEAFFTNLPPAVFVNINHYLFISGVFFPQLCRGKFFFLIWKSYILVNLLYEYQMNSNCGIVTSFILLWSLIFYCHNN